MPAGRLPHQPRRSPTKGPRLELRDRVSERDIAALLGMAVAHLRDLLAGAKSRRVGRDRCYRWRDVEPVLTTEQVALARAATREARSKPHGSKYLVGGYPHLVREWHPTRNGELLPDDVRYGSNRRVWWQCASGHEWESVVYSRTIAGGGCPFCANLRVSDTNSLAARYPELARQWHPERNSALTPRDVVFGARRRVWWQCPEGPEHQWEATVKSRTGNGAGCPYCANLRVSSTNSLAAVYPEVAKQWHPTKNGKLTAGDVLYGTPRRIWWQCPAARDHHWQASVVNRKNGSACPFCAGKRASSSYCLSKCCPHLAREWHPTRNRPLTPRLVVPGSSRKVWWRCSDGHEWRAAPSSRTRGGGGTGCPYCAGQLPSARYTLASVHPKIARQWHGEKNGTLTPAAVTPSSSRSVWWKCPAGPDHEWRAKVSGRARGAGCPFCAGQRVSRTNSLRARHPRIAKEWHPLRNGDLGPDDVVGGTHRKVWWRCAKGHDWPATVDSRTRRAEGCPYCSGRRLTPAQSLASRRPAVAAQWDAVRNGDLTPRDVAAFSHREVWWVCPHGTDHVWEARVSERSKGSSCPFCSNHRVAPDSSLLAARPDVAALWHATRNPALDPRSVVPGSGRQVWWRCPAGHEWHRSITRQVGSKGCPACAVAARQGKAALIHEIAGRHPSWSAGRVRVELLELGFRIGMRTVQRYMPRA